jgi:hypothetical protein
VCHMRESKFVIADEAGKREKERLIDDAGAGAGVDLCLILPCTTDD